MAMSGGTPAAPPAPDPVATAAAQAKLNKETAVAQTGLNAIDQITPDGSLNYSQAGTWSDGTPRFTATTTLSDANKGIYNTDLATKQNIANIGRDQSGRIGDLLGTPLKLGNEASEARIFELGSKRLNPKFAAEADALRTRLANSGIQPGSAAYDAEMRSFNAGKNDAFNSLLLSGRGAANTELMAERNSPINEITALLSGSQITSPSFTSTPTSQIGGVDYMGAVNNNYNAQVQQQKMAMDRDNATMGGLFGLGGTVGAAALKYAPAAMMAFSDRRLKSDVTRVGTTEHGLPLYEYTIFGERQRGVMADEVEQVMPDAVIMGSSGFKMVNYQMLGLA